MKQVKATLNGIDYILSYNSQSDYYEATLIAPEETGLHVIQIEYSDDNGGKTTDTKDLIVLAPEIIKRQSTEIIAFFLDKQTFEIKDVTQVNIEKINRDLETNGNSIFVSPKRVNAEEDDFIYLKKNDEMNFLGLVLNMEDSDKSGRYQITCKDIMSIFDFESFVENQDSIKTVGIEDFIMNRIKEEYVTNTDNFVNRSFFTVEASTHNPKQIQVSSLVDIIDGTYNFLTFVNNAIETYDLYFGFTLDRNLLHLTIGKKQEEKILIDATCSDISNYSETFALSVVAKVEVFVEETGTKYYRYLLNDRTTTTDKNNPNRIFGKTARIQTEKTEEAEQRALDQFKGNSYNHNITFSMNKNTKLHDIKKLELGTPIQIKTKNNIIKDTYISKIQDDESEFIVFTCGNIRVEYIDKFLQERRKQK